MPLKKKAGNMVRRALNAVKTKLKKGVRTAAGAGAAVKEKTPPNHRRPPRGEESAAAAKPVPAKTAMFKRKGQTRLVTFVRDPHCLFAYWEIDQENLDNAWRALGHEFPFSERVLRVYRTGPDGRRELYEETTVQPWEMNRYIHLPEAGGTYFVEIGLKSRSGKYFALADSGKVTTAPGRMSPVIDPLWAPSLGIMEYFSEEEETGGSQPGGFFSASLGMGPARVAKKRMAGMAMQRVSGSLYAASYISSSPLRPYK